MGPYFRKILYLDPAGALVAEPGERRGVAIAYHPNGFSPGTGEGGEAFTIGPFPESVRIAGASTAPAREADFESTFSTIAVVVSRVDRAGAPNR